jgi:three-Cys-motif partner protein
MPKKEYDWEGTNVPIIGEHSIAKHRILREYVRKYIEILTRNPKIERLKLTFVDGFAGGGIYERSAERKPHFGSPVILIEEATAVAQARWNLARHKPVILEPTFFFIDKKPTNIAVLQETLRSHVYPEHPGIAPTILTGTFEEQLAPIVASIKKQRGAHRAIFLLDQYGYTQVPLPSLQLIFRELPKAEVFLTLAVGWISAYLRDAACAPEILRRMGVRTEATEEEIQEQLLGGDASDDKFRRVQWLLHHAFVQPSGARYATPFFIVSPESHRRYWFLHLANNLRANDVVKELHWTIQNHFSHYGDTGLAMLGFDPRREPDPGQLSFAFDSFAKQRTERALLIQLPERIRSRHAEGVGFGDLFAEVANETPATKEMVRAALTKLCWAGDLTKRGGGGEQRRVETVVQDDDIVVLAKQIRMPW